MGRKNAILWAKQYANIGYAKTSRYHREHWHSWLLDVRRLIFCIWYILTRALRQSRFGSDFPRYAKIAKMTHADTCLRACSLLAK